MPLIYTQITENLKFEKVQKYLYILRGENMILNKRLSLAKEENQHVF